MTIEDELVDALTLKSEDIIEDHIQTLYGLLEAGLTLGLTSDSDIQLIPSPGPCLIHMYDDQWAIVLPPGYQTYTSDELQDAQTRLRET